MSDEQRFIVDTGSASNRLSADEVTHIADLARIALTNDEVESFRQQLSEVIDYNMGLLAELDLTDIEPTAQTTGLTNQWREDQPELSLLVEVALENAPQQQDQQFVVQKVLD